MYSENSQGPATKVAHADLERESNGSGCHGPHPEDRAKRSVSKDDPARTGAGALLRHATLRIAAQDRLAEIAGAVAAKLNWIVTA